MWCGAVQSLQASVTPDPYEMAFPLFFGHGRQTAAQRVQKLELRRTTSGIPVLN